MLELLLGVFVKIVWVHDRLTPQTARQRHLGRPVTATYYPDDKSDSSYELLGTLEAIEGETIVISGKDYPFGQLVNLRVWRKALERKSE